MNTKKFLAGAVIALTLMFAGMASVQAAGFKNAGLQVQEYVYDFAVHGGVYTSAIELSNSKTRLPIGAIVTNVYVHVVTAPTGSSSTVAAGNATTANAYIAAVAEATLAINYVTSAEVAKGASLWDDSNDNLIPYRVADADKSKFMMTIGTANLTAGKIIFLVEYLNPSL